MSIAKINCRRCGRHLQFDGALDATLPFEICAVCYPRWSAKERRVIEKARGLRDHGEDMKNGTHAQILWAALADLEAMKQKNK